MRVVGNGVMAVYGLRAPSPTEVRAAASTSRASPHSFPAGVDRHPDHASANGQAEAWDVGAAVRRQGDVARGLSISPRGQGPGRPADWSALARVAAAMEECGADYAVAGGYGLALNGVRGRLDDVDLLVSDASRNSVAWTDAMCAVFPDLTAALRAWDVTPFAVGAGGGPGPVRVVGDYPVDIVPRVGGLTLEGLADHVSAVDWSGARIRVLDLVGLRLSKSYCHARLRDRADVSAIDAALAALDGDPKAHASVDVRGRIQRGKGWVTPVGAVRRR